MNKSLKWMKRALGPYWHNWEVVERGQVVTVERNHRIILKGRLTGRWIRGLQELDITVVKIKTEEHMLHTHQLLTEAGYC